MKMEKSYLQLFPVRVQQLKYVDEGRHNTADEQSSASSSARRREMARSPRGREIIGGRVVGARDRSFLCLLTIYAAHVLTYHVLDVTQLVPILAGKAQPEHLLPHLRHQRNDRKNLNGTGYIEDGQLDSEIPAVGRFLHRQLRLEVLVSSPFYLDTLNDQSTSNMCTDLNYLFILPWIRSVKKMFSTAALSPSTWGVISGCAIFLLTYSDRENT